MSTVSRTLFAAAVAFVGLSWSASRAEAVHVETSTSVFGNSSVTGLVATFDIGGVLQQRVVWYRHSDGSCLPSTNSLGPSTGLNDHTEVVGGAADDAIFIVTWSGSFCGYNFTPLVYGGKFLDLYGADGNDSLYGYGGGDTWVHGGGHNDYLYSENPAGTLEGLGGDDTLQAGSSGAGETLLGGDGNDCLYDANSSASVFDCGAGTDKRVSGFSVPHASCESAPAGC
jgi:Ca2+-binding RTX toxin-like protein